MKRIMLALTFVAALAAGGLGMSSKAAAWHGCHESYGYGHYGGYRSYPVYYSDWGYSPRHSYYGGYSRRHYHRSHWHDHHHDHGGIHFSFGF
jgi:hypothetical protein